MAPNNSGRSSNAQQPKPKSYSVQVNKKQPKQKAQPKPKAPPAPKSAPPSAQPPRSKPPASIRKSVEATAAPRSHIGTKLGDANPSPGAPTSAGINVGVDGSMSEGDVAFVPTTASSGGLLSTGLGDNAVDSFMAKDARRRRATDTKRARPSTVRRVVLGSKRLGKKYLTMREYGHDLAVGVDPEDAFVATATFNAGFENGNESYATRGSASQRDAFVGSLRGGVWGPHSSVTRNFNSALYSDDSASGDSVLVLQNSGGRGTLLGEVRGGSYCWKDPESIYAYMTADTSTSGQIRVDRWNEDDTWTTITTGTYVAPYAGDPASLEVTSTGLSVGYYRVHYTLASTATTAACNLLSVTLKILPADWASVATQFLAPDADMQRELASGERFVAGAIEVEYTGSTLYDGGKIAVAYLAPEQLGDPRSLTFDDVAEFPGARIIPLKRGMYAIVPPYGVAQTEYRDPTDFTAPGFLDARLPIAIVQADSPESSYTVRYHANFETVGNSQILAQSPARIAPGERAALEAAFGAAGSMLAMPRDTWVENATSIVSRIALAAADFATGGAASQVTSLASDLGRMTL